MAERRISYSRDKVDVIERLVGSENLSGPFRLIADVLVFAAALGFGRKRRIALGSSIGEPIRQQIFDRHGYDTMMNLLALHVQGDVEVLSDTEEMIELRAVIFEEYANGGLEILREELAGAVNTLETIVLLISSERSDSPDGGLEGFDLTKVM